MDKRGIIKLGAAGILFGALIVFIILVFSSSGSFAATQKPSYSLGESVKLNFKGIYNYKAKIMTPTTSFVKEGSDDVFLFNPKEIGNYKVSWEVNGKLESYEFEVVGEKKTNEPVTKTNEPKADDGFYTAESRNLTEENITLKIDNEQKVKTYRFEVGKPAYHIINVSANEKKIAVKVPSESENISVYRKATREKVDSRISKPFLSFFSKSKSVVIQDASQELEVEYYTPGPEKRERNISESKKEVVVYSDGEYNYTNILSYTDVPEQVSLQNKNLIRVYWKNENKDVEFNALDTNGNGLIDRIEWIVPHLSEQTFDIIIIAKAEHLDENRNSLSDISELLVKRDNIYADIPDGHFVRVSFERELTSSNDITIYAKSSSSNAHVEVYEEDSDIKIADFGEIRGDGEYRILLSKLWHSQRTFDLKVVGGEVAFDFIIDPPVNALYYLQKSGTNYYFNNKSASGTQQTESCTGSSSGSTCSYTWTKDSTYTIDTNITTDVINAKIFYNSTSSGTPTYSRIDSASVLDCGTSSTCASSTVICTTGSNSSCESQPGNCNVTVSCAALASEYAMHAGDYLGFSITVGGRKSIVTLRYNSSATNTYFNITERPWADESPPIITIVSPQNTSYNYTSLGFNVSLNENGSWCGYSLDGAANVTMTRFNGTYFNYTKTGLSEGQHNLSFSCNDTVGNMNSSSGILPFFIDLTSPVVTINQPLNVTYTLSYIDFIFSMNEEGFCNYSLTNGVVNYSMTPDVTQTVFNATNNSIADGFYTVRAYCRDSAGNRNFTTSQTFNKNTSAYPSTILSSYNLLSSGTTYYFNNDSVNGVQQMLTCTGSASGTTCTWNWTRSSAYLMNTNITTSTILSRIYYNSTVTGSSPTSYISSIVVLDCGASSTCAGSPTAICTSASEPSPGACHNQGTGCSVDITCSPGAEYAMHTGDYLGFRVNMYAKKATAYMRYNSSATNSFFNITEKPMYDQTPPVISIVSPLSQNYTTASIRFNVSLNESGNWCGYSLDGAENVSMTAYNATYFNYTNTTMTEGQHSVVFSCNDSLGNMNSSSGIRYFGVDTIFPTINFTNQTDANDSISNRSFIIINVSANDSGTGIRNITVFLYNSSNAMINSSNTTANSLYINFSRLNDGIYYFNATAFDIAGNANFTETRKVTIDSNPPFVNITFPLNFAYYNYTVSLLNYTASDFLGVSRCWYSTNFGAWNSTEQDPGIGWDMISNEGANNWTVYCNDTTGKLNSSRVNFIRDIVLPSGALKTPVNGSLVSNLTQNLTINISDSQRLGNVTLFVYNSSNSIINQTVKSVSGTQALVGIVYNFPADGAYKWSYLVMDYAGNTLLTDNNTLLIHTEIPVVNITFPLNTVYATNVSALNYTYNDTYPGSCWYSTNSGATNLSTQSPSTNWTNVNSDDGVNVWTVYCNDSAGNLKITSVSFIKDTFVNPQINFSNPTLSSGVFTSNTTVLINLSILEYSLGELNFNFNNTNFSFYNNSLILMYNFDNVSSLGESSASNFTYDASRYGYHGNCSGMGAGCNYTNGMYGKSISFDGGSSALSVASNDIIGVTASSICVWVNVMDWGGANNGRIIDNGNTRLAVVNSISGVRFASDGSTYLDSQNNVITFGQWTHICATRNASGYANIYVQGAWNSAGTSGTPTAGSSNVFIGNIAALNRGYDGLIDEVRIWNRTLSAAEVYEIYVSNLQKFNQIQWYLLVNQSKNSSTGLDDGLYRYFANAIDLTGNSNATETRNITVDTIYPRVNITFPLNTSYFVNITEINYTIIEVNPNRCWYSNNSGRWNSTSVQAGNNFSNVSSVDGYNNWTLYCNDSTNKLNISNVGFFRHMLPPNGTLISPINNTFSNNLTQNMSVNATDIVGLSNATLNIYNSTNSLINQTTRTVSGTEALVGIVYNFLYDGVFKWFYQIRDVANNLFTTGNNTITIDRIAPVLNITFPLNNTNYFVNINQLNYTYLDANAGRCWYSNNSGIWNSTNVSAGNNFSSVVSVEGWNNWTLYCNDSAGNLNSTRIVFYKDAAYPQVSFIDPTLSSGAITTNTSVLFNISIVENNLTEIKFNWDSVNYTMYDNTLLLMLNLDNVSSLGESSASNFTYDTSPNRNFGNCSGMGAGCNYTPGMYGKGVFFGGTDEFINVSSGNGLTFSGTNQMTLSVWTYTNSTSKQYFMFHGFGCLSWASYYLSIGGNENTNLPNQYAFGFGTTTGAATNNNVASTGNALTNQWVLVTATYDGSSLSLYLNGQLNNTAAGSGNIWSNPERLYIGADPGCGIRGPMNGIIDEPRIWNRSLSESEIYEMYISNLQKYNQTQWYLYLNQSKNITSQLEDGTYNYFSSAKDVLDRENVTLRRNVTVDTLYPILNITYPLNTTYYNNVSTIIYSYIDANPGRCWYSNNSGRWNSSSVSAGTTITNANSIDGWNNWTLYCNDSVGHLNSTTVDFYRNMSTFAVVISTPASGYYNYSISLLNYTAHAPTGISKCWYSNNSGRWNSTEQDAEIGWSDMISNEGANNWTLYCNDTSGALNYSRVNFIIDTVSPNGTLISPLNGSLVSNLTQNLSVNATDNRGLSNVSLYVFNSSYDLVNVTSRSVSGVEAIVGIIYNFIYDGIFNWFYKIADLAGNYYTTPNNTIIVHTIPPGVNITYPLEIVYNTDITMLNYTYNDTYTGKCWYSDNSGATNSSAQSPSGNWTGLTSVEGTNIWNLYCNDSAGNLNTTTVIFIKDTLTYPLINFTSATYPSGTIIPYTTVPVNASITELSLSEVKFNWNGTNFTIYNNSLVLMYNLDNRSLLDENDTWIADLSRYGNNGTVFGSARWNSSGKYNGAYNFDGINDYISATDAPNLRLTGGRMTLSAWVNTRSTSKQYFVFHGLGCSTWASYYLSIGGNENTNYPNQYAFGFGTSNAATDNNVAATGTALTNQWVFVTATYNGSLLSIYINGQLNNTAAGSGSPWSSTENLYLGTDPGCGIRGQLNGTLDEPRIWNRSLSAAEVYEMYASNLQKYSQTQWYLSVSQSKNASTGLSDGIYNYFASVRNIGNYENLTETRNITIDTIKPVINITYPLLNINYTVNVSQFNHTYFDLNPSYCWYSNNSGRTNSTANSSGNNFTNVFSNEGYNNWTLYCNDSAGNLNSSSVRFILHMLPPNGTLISPINNTFSNNVTQNMSVNATDIVGLSNVTLNIYNSTDSLINQTTRTVSGTEALVGIVYNFLYDGVFKWFYQIRDVANNLFTTGNNTITIDTHSPQVTIVDPQSITYGIGAIPFNFTLNESGTCQYTLTGGITNYSMTANATRTGFTASNASMADGTYTIFAYCNDSAGNKNLTVNQTFMVNTIIPMVTVISPLNQTYTYSNIDFNVSLNKNGSMCLFSLNNWQTNYTMTRLNDTYYNYTNGSVSDGNILARFWCNDTFGNTNGTSRVNFTVETLFPLIDYGLRTAPDGSNLSQNWIFVNVSVIEANLVNITFLLRNTTGEVNRTTYYNQTYSINFTNLPNGNYTYNVSVADIVNHINSTSTYSIVLDTTLPNGTLISPPNGTITNITTQNMTVNLSDNAGLRNATLNIYDSTNSLVNQTTVSVSGSEAVLGVIYNFISDGIFRWFYQVRDIANNLFTTQNNTITVDRTRPVIVLNTQNNSIFNSSSVILNYTASDNMNVTRCDLYLNGVYNRSNQTIITNGQLTNFSFTAEDGAYNWAVMCIDIANNTNTSETRRFIVDTHLPLIDLISPSNNEVVIGNNVTFNFTVNDNIDTNLTCNLTVNGVVEISQFSALNGTNTSRNVTFAVGGDKLWNVTCWDDAGNINTSQTRNLTLAFPPEVFLISPNNGASVNSSMVSFIYNTTDANYNIANATLILNGQRNISNQSAIINGVFSNFTLSLGDGYYNWTVNVTDLTNLEATNRSSRILTVDTHAPNILLNYPTLDLMLSTNNVSFNFTALDYIDTNLTCNLTVDGVLQSPNSFGVTNGSNYVKYILRYDGDHNWSVKCIDDAGNVNQSTINNFSIEAPPNVSLISPQSEIYLNNQTTVFTYLPQDPIGITNCSLYIDGAINATNTTVGANQNNNFSIVNISEGRHNWTVGCIDAVPDYNFFAPSVRNFTKDSMPPIVALLYPKNNTNSLNTEIFNFTVNDNIANISNCTLYLDSIANFSNVNVSNGTIYSRQIRGISLGRHLWNVSCYDYANNTGWSNLWEFNVTMSDLSVNENEIFFNNSNPTENESINITATIRNLANVNVTSVIVQFFDGDPAASGTQIGSNINISFLQGLGAVNASVNWNAKMGTSYIFVVVDPPLASNGIYSEWNETNNKANKSVISGSWHIIYGKINDESELELSKQNNYSVIRWQVSNSSRLNIYAADLESSISWLNIKAIGRNKTGGNSPSDFSKIDTFLSMTNFSDSVNNTFTANGQPKGTRNFTIFGRNITYVPIANSTNTSNFVTGILWDTADDSDNNGNYSGTDKEDLVFITETNRNMPGAYGIYDYEFRIPARLREYYTADTRQVVFYTEIT